MLSAYGNNTLLIFMGAKTMAITLGFGLGIRLGQGLGHLEESLLLLLCSETLDLSRRNALLNLHPKSLRSDPDAAWNIEHRVIFKLAQAQPSMTCLYGHTAISADSSEFSSVRVSPITNSLPGPPVRSPNAGTACQA